MCVWRVEANGEVDEVNRSWNFRLLVRREPFVLLSRYSSRLYHLYINKKVSFIWRALSPVDNVQDRHR